MKVIILCGGMGTRLREETEYKPKPMVEIGGQTHSLAHHETLCPLRLQGICAGPGLQRRHHPGLFPELLQLQQRFYSGSGQQRPIWRVHNACIKEDWKVTLVETGDNSMTGYRTLLCSRHITEDRFMLTYGDAVSNVNIKRTGGFSAKNQTP
jgi:glucose-1-phosphate cytidylyltransferase